MYHYLNSVETTLKNLNSSEMGLTQEEAEKRLAENGRNELAKAKSKSMFSRIAEQIINPMILILLAAATVSVILAALEPGGGLHAYAESAVILAVVILNTILGVVQESKAEKAIEALQEMSAATAKVRRGNIVSQIPASELVIGDMVLIEAGDAIPADMRLIRNASLRIEEAALTGESVPSNKKTEALQGDESGSVPLGDRKNMAYMGTSVAYGRGEGVITDTGMKTEMGKIAGIIQNAQEGETPLQKRLSQLSKILTILVLGICVIIFVIRLISVEAIDANIIVGSFMLAISLAVAAIPEGLVAVITIVLSIGVTKMAKHNAIIRKLTAVETLGCAQIICSDKTGTLTQNKMTVVESYGENVLLAKAMALCCDSQLAPDGSIVGDPTENALVAFALKEGFDKNTLAAEFKRIAEAPFDSVRKMMSTVHLAGKAGATNGKIVQYTKGAPDEILRVCTHALLNGQVVPLTPAITQTITDKNKEYADRALRVLACAYREWNEAPADPAPEKIETSLTFIGLEAMIDPLRPEIKAAVDECKSSGIKVVMITGDHKETAAAIALEAGIIASKDQAITGRELDGLSDEEFEKRVGSIFVYARVQPEHKVRIVNMWKQKGCVTAMTGDGVNDAPAIKSGDIGIGMGITGTDVTKNVADMVLADDNFATIVSAVAEGRRIYDNIRKTLQFLLSTNLSEIIIVLTATLMGFVIFKPVHLLFINLITDTVPAVALGMEHAEGDIMKRPPRGQKESIFSDGLGFGILYQGVIIGLLTLAAYMIVDIWNGHEAATTSAFFTLSICEIFQAFTMRSLKRNIFTLKKQNIVLWGALAFSLTLALLVIYVPFLADVFSLTPLGIKEILTSLGLAVSIIPIIEAVKAIQRKMRKN